MRFFSFLNKQEKNKPQKQIKKMSTCCVKLSLLKLSLIYYKGSVAGKLQHSTDQAIRCVVFVWNKSWMVHVFNGHL